MFRAVLIPRLQELVRLMSESTLDVLTIQSGLRKAVDDASTVLRSQSRAGRELQDTLMRVRTVAFTTVVDRLHRVLRQACRELGKKARLGVDGQHVELDRGVLEKLVPALEHLLRNCIAHGVELPEVRIGDGKSEYGDVRVVVRQEASEIILEVTDDGAGLDYRAIRERAVADSLIEEGDAPDDEATLDRIIFGAGFSTSSEVTGLAGRGVGLDAVRSDVQALGGWVEVLSEAGRGSAFRLHLPLTLVVAQTLLVRCAERSYALPTQAVEHVHRLDARALEETQSEGFLNWAGRRYAYHYLPHLLGEGVEPPRERHNPLVLARAGDECLALQVDTTLRSHEAVLRNLGPQIASIPGVIGATVLSSGEITPIVNPFYLARGVATARRRPPPAPAAASGDGGPLVMVVDDSLTVRRVLENLLTRQGYEVLTARDGAEAGNLLREYHPDVMLVDIEMPRMDGFELTRQVRAHSATADIPIVMITSRSADKHREHAMKLGADVFLGKPFVEDELLAHVSSFVNRARARSVGPAGA